MKPSSIANRLVLLLVFIAGFSTLFVSRVQAELSSTNFYYSMQHPIWPPMPGPWPDVQTYWLSNNVYLMDDLEVDYDELQAQYLIGRGDDNGGGYEAQSSGFAADELWIEITGVDHTNALTFLTLHGTIEGDKYQLLSKTNLTQPGEWKLGEIITGAAATNQTDFSPARNGNNPMMFYRAHHANLILSIANGGDAIETNSVTHDQGVGRFVLSTHVTPALDLPAFYRIGGSAQNGVDYTNISSPATISSNSGFAEVFIHTKPDDCIEFIENVTLTLIQTNTYLIATNMAFATLTITENLSTNMFTTVVTNLNSPVGIDYHTPSNALVVSFNVANNGQPNNFALISSTGVTRTNWSGVSGLTEEIKVATVKQTANGFTNGDMYFGTGIDGVVGWLSAGGTKSNLTWAVLSTNGDNQTLMRGGLHIDQSGSFGGDLIVVTGGQPAEGGGVWRISSANGAVQSANITNTHLEGVITLTNDVAKWGPWSGKIITGAESASPPLLFSIDTNGIVAAFDLGIGSEDFDLIPPDQDLYCVDAVNQKVVKLSKALLACHVGDLLITQSGDGQFGTAPKLFVVSWDSSAMNFAIRTIPYLDGVFEHVTFAPINLPSLP